MKIQKLLVAMAVLLLLTVGMVSAQNLLQDNPHARRARDLRQQSEVAFN